MPKMISLTRHRYNGQNIKQNDVFHVSDKDVRLLTALKRAVKYVSSTHEYDPILGETAVVVPVQEVQREKVVEEHSMMSSDNDVVEVQPEPTQTDDHMQMLRDRATALGIRVDGRWSAWRLQREIDNHNTNTYSRMDLKAEK